MANFYKPAKKKTGSQPRITLDIERLDHKGRGLGFHNGKAIFVAGTLPGESARVQLTEVKKQYAVGRLLKLETTSDERIAPKCPWFGRCGGCQLQYLENGQQQAYKQASLKDLYQRNGIVVPEMSAPLVADDWHYRRTIRLALRVNRKTKQLEMGLRQGASQDICEIDQCAVLHPELEALLPTLRELFESIRDKQGLGHLELFRVDSGIIILLRLTKGLGKEDRDTLGEFVAANQDPTPMTLFLQPSADSVDWFAGSEQAPAYQLELAGQGAVELAFTPGDFLQVNSEINQAMVQQALDWLDVQPGERVLDLFSGIGNFSLPLARQAASVVAVEGIDAMTTRCLDNARLNGLDNLECYSTDLSQDFSEQPWARQGFDKVLLDPARAGAAGVIPYLAKVQAKSIVYVACDAATMARDAAQLCQQGYQLKRLGLVDMFPQTAHLESMALFEPS